MTENAGNQIIAVLQWPRRDSFKPTDVVSLPSRVLSHPKISNFRLCIGNTK
jgi:hypothetical protein